MDFNQYFNGLPEESRTESLLQALSLCSELIGKKDESSAELESCKKENETLKSEVVRVNARLENAKSIFQEMKMDVENAGLRARKSIYQETQIVRDRLFVIAQTVSEGGDRQLKNSRQKMTAVEFNNILDSVGLIIENLQKCGLWADSDPVPALDHLQEAVKKSSTGKKKTKSAEIPAEDAAVEQVTIDTVSAKHVEVVE